MVGLVLELTRRIGNDPAKTITMDRGNGQRKITIHALDELPNAGAKPTAVGGSATSATS